MEDLASEFQDDFLETVKVLEDFCSSDSDLRKAMTTIRERIAAKTYRCVPQFWSDLRETLGAIEQQREDKGAKTKVHQVLKHIARLEVKFWAKDACEDLRKFEPQQRLELMVGWIENLSPTESRDHGKDVLYKVLNEFSLQKDMDVSQRDTLSDAVRENLHKFPIEMQAVLQQVGSLQSGNIVQRVVSDWRRRSQPTSQEALLPTSALASIGKGAVASASHAIEGPVLGADANPSAATDMAGAAALFGFAPAAQGEEEEAPLEEDEAYRHQPFNMDEVDPEAVAKTRTAVLAALVANGGGCPRQYVRILLKQGGIAGMPIAKLGPEVFFSSTEVFLRRPGAPPPLPVLLPPGQTPVPEDLQQHMVATVREAGGRIPLTQLIERLQWHNGSLRHAMHGTMKKAVAQVPELFFEPETVYTVFAASSLVAVLAPEEQEQPAPEVTEVAVGAVPYVSDPFAELLATILAWLQQADGVLPQTAVLPLIKVLGFKTKAVISALSPHVFWSHPEADCELLLRTKAGAAQHPKPLPDNYLHQQVHQMLLKHVRDMGAKAKADKLAGLVGWNAKSELKRTYGTLRLVLAGIREVFFDSTSLYLKTSLTGIVEWPVSRDGRLGPQQTEEAVVQHWTPKADDMKGAGDPEWLNAKRQLLCTVMSLGGQCPEAVLRQLLQSLLESVQFEALFEPNSPHDLSNVLCWPRNVVHLRRIQDTRPTADQVPEEARQLLINGEARRRVVDTVRERLVVTLEQLQAVLDGVATSIPVTQEVLAWALPHIPEVLYVPDTVFLQHAFHRLVVLARQDDAVLESAEANAGSSTAVTPTTMPSSTEVGADLPTLPVVDGADASLAELLDADAADEDSGAAEVAAGGEAPPLKYYSFSDFKLARERPPITIERPPVRRRRLDEAGAAWSDEAPPWATEGALVTVRPEQGEDGGADGVIIRVSGSSCTVRLRSARSGQAEREFSTPTLLPVVPKVGATVRVVMGNKSGLQGTLVSLAGSEGVVQIGGVLYETVPMGHLAVLAS